MAKEKQGRYEPICNSRWKPLSLVLGLACLATFAWGFHILTDYYDWKMEAEYLYDDIAMPIHNVGGNMPDRLNSVVSKAVVSIGDAGSAGFAGKGSGVIINRDGYVVTALHSISGIRDIVVKVQTSQGPKQYRAEIVKTAKSHDLALVKLLSHDLFPFLALGDSRSLQSGETVYALGAGRGANIVVKKGSVGQTGAGLALGEALFTNMIQTDAVHEWIQSGGPLLNSAAVIVGINMAVETPGKGVVGYAVPSHIMVAHFQDIVEFMIAEGVAGQVSVQPSRPGGTTTVPGNNLSGVEPQEMEMGINAALAYSRTGSLGFNIALGKGQGVNPVDAAHATGWTLWGYSPRSIIGLAALGLVAGISGGMMTMGGGIIMVTGLMLFFGYGTILIRPAAYITNIFLYGSAALRYHRDGMIVMDKVRSLVPWAMAGVIFGYVVGNYIGSRFIHYMLGAFALVLGIKVLIEIFQSPEGSTEPDVEQKNVEPESGTGSILDRLVNQDGYLDKGLLKNGILGVPMGVISGILGISGGVVEVPLQRYVSNVPIKNAIANSSVMVFFVSLVGSATAMLHGVGIGAFEFKTPLALALVLIPGAYVGGMIGAWLTRIAPLNLIRWVCAVLMFFISAKMFFL